MVVNGEVQDMAMDCTTAAGIGSNLMWNVEVAGQFDLKPSDEVTTSYKEPNITRVVPPEIPTGRDS